MISIPKDEFRRLLNDIQAYLDNPSLPDIMAKLAIGTLRMYDIEGDEAWNGLVSLRNSKRMDKVSGTTDL